VGEWERGVWVGYSCAGMSTRYQGPWHASPPTTPLPLTLCDASPSADSMCPRLWSEEGRAEGSAGGLTRGALDAERSEHPRHKGMRHEGLYPPQLAPHTLPPSAFPGMEGRGRGRSAPKRYLRSFPLSIILSSLPDSCRHLGLWGAVISTPHRLPAWRGGAAETLGGRQGHLKDVGQAWARPGGGWGRREEAGGGGRERRNGRRGGGAVGGGRGSSLHGMGQGQGPCPCRRGSASLGLSVLCIQFSIAGTVTFNCQLSLHTHYCTPVHPRPIRDEHASLSGSCIGFLQQLPRCCCHK